MENVRLLDAGEQGLVVEFGDAIDPEINRRVHVLARDLGNEGLPAIAETVPTYRSLSIYFDPLTLSKAELKSIVRRLLEREQGPGEASREKRIVIIPVCYGGTFGPDLSFVADYTKLTPEEVVALHISEPYLVYMLGFIPGFPYLGGLPEKLAAPRLEKPRVKIPAGSVGIAGTQTGFYALESPGGWRIIGRTPFQGFPLESAGAPLFSAGDYLRFRSVTEREYDRIRSLFMAGEYEAETYAFKEGPK